MAEVMCDAEARYWDRRAEEFADAAPKVSDHRGGVVDFDTGRPLTPGACQAARTIRLAAAEAECWSRAEELRAAAREEIW